MSRYKSKLALLMKLEGYTNTNDWLWDNLCNSLVEGICTARDCDYTTQVEPDQDKGWCEVCRRNTVKSGQILIGF